MGYVEQKPTDTAISWERVGITSIREKRGP